ncbi:hypothetical protein [Streptomyces sp. NPDC007346]|uniref:hypothetical protein n=1 Tax=Streptomyces sp. NPDC007346 TaxID=3154682 RepID=UPI003451D3E8
MTQLHTARLTEIRDLVTLLAADPAGPEAPADQRALLARCRTALVDVLADRDDLARSAAETAEELTMWTGAL